MPGLRPGGPAARRGPQHPISGRFMPLAYLIGIDVGTSGTKTLLADADGRIAARATVDYPLHAPRPAWAEQDAEDWWNAAVEDRKSTRLNSSHVKISYAV